MSGYSVVSPQVFLTTTLLKFEPRDFDPEFPLQIFKCEGYQLHNYMNKFRYGGDREKGKKSRDGGEKEMTEI